MERDQRIKFLIERFIADDLLPEESEELHKLLQQEDPATFEQVFLNFIEKEPKSSPKNHYQYLIRDILAIDRVKLKPFVNPRPSYRSIAASFLIFILTAALFWFFKPKHHQEHALAQQKESQIFNAEHNKAILILSNGKTISLSGFSNDIQDGGETHISNNRQGELIYNISSTDKTTPHNDLKYNTIVTPKGGQYKIVLPDGSKVWVNSASSLKYPVHFAADKREVYLEGEAYFEVAKLEDGRKKVPFFVQTPQQHIEVLGTHFNVSAFPDDKTTTTTLLEGSIQLSSIEHPVAKKLKAGEKAVLFQEKIRIEQDSTQDAIAWMSGEFVFKEQNIKDIMRQLARWYDIEVAYQTDTQHKDFTGTVSKFKTIEEVLRKLAYTDIIHFKIEGRRVTVMP